MYFGLLILFFSMALSIKTRGFKKLSASTLGVLIISRGLMAFGMLLLAILSFKMGEGFLLDSLEFSLEVFLEVFLESSSIFILIEACLLYNF